MDMAVAIIKFVSIMLLFMVTTVDIGARMVLNGFKYRKNRKVKHLGHKVKCPNYDPAVER